MEKPSLLLFTLLSSIFILQSLFSSSADSQRDTTSFCSSEEIFPEQLTMMVRSFLSYENDCLIAETVQLTAALSAVESAATRVRAANWCALIATILPADMHEKAYLEAIIASDYCIPPPPIKSRPIANVPHNRA